jgi:hypothetical protein
VPGIGLGGAAFANTSSIVALDCEMVAGASRAQHVCCDLSAVAVAGTGPGGEKSALARVAIVDWNGEVLLDTFVKPQEKVTPALAREVDVCASIFGFLRVAQHCRRYWITGLGCQV